MVFVAAALALCDTLALGNRPNVGKKTNNLSTPLTVNRLIVQANLITEWDASTSL